MVIASGELDRRSTEVIEVTLTTDTAVYAPGDVVADTQVIDRAFRGNNSGGRLVSVEVVDEDDQKANLDIYFLTANVSMGTENAAPSISDANARSIQGKISIAVADYNDLGGVSVAQAASTQLPRALESIAGTDDLAIAVVAGATTTPTYTATGLKLRLGIEQD